jgi:hypothetical protein
MRRALFAACRCFLRCCLSLRPYDASYDSSDSESDAEDPRKATGSKADQIRYYAEIDTTGKHIDIEIPGGSSPLQIEDGFMFGDMTGLKIKQVLRGIVGSAPDMIRVAVTSMDEAANIIGALVTCRIRSGNVRLVVKDCHKPDEYQKLIDLCESVGTIGGKVEVDGGGGCMKGGYIDATKTQLKGIGFNIDEWEDPYYDLAARFGRRHMQVYNAYTVPKQRSLRKDMLKPRDQGDHGACCAYAAAAIMEYHAKKLYGINDRFDPMVIFNMRDRADEMALATLAKVVSEYRNKRREVCPNDRVQRLTDHIVQFYGIESAELIDTVEKAKHALANVGPLLISLPCHKATALDFWKIPYLSYPPSQDGHAVVIDSYSDDDGTFGIRNSWGTSWGDQGFHYISYADFMAYALGCVLLKPAKRIDKKYDPRSVM